MMYTSDHILKALTSFFHQSSTPINSILLWLTTTKGLYFFFEHCLHITNSTTCNKIIVFIDFLFNQHIFI